ncbi:TIM barrel protein [Bengtsoniella intestinalis]|uniref:TIM barrel protein n=1 Tax=Bengtsoniella intestinalis TaxID=3073143 RepID=UPI00391F2245
MAAGYTGVELRSIHINPNTDAETVEAVKAYCAEHKLDIVSLSCFTGNYGLFDDAQCQDAFEVLKGFVQLACTLNCNFVRVWAAWEESKTASEEVRARAALWMQKSADYAAEYNKSLVMEMHHGTLCDTADSCAELIARIDRKNVGLILDAVNLYQVPVADVPALVRQLGSSIFHVHVKDIIQMPTSDYPYGFEYNYYAKHIGRFTPVVAPSGNRTEYYCHRRINQGGVDWMSILNALKDIGYDGYLSVESVCETNKLMPQGRKLAFACYKDLVGLLQDVNYDKNWHVVSPTVKGMHKVVDPAFRDCEVSHILRLNLDAGDVYELNSEDKEMNAVMVAGSASLELEGQVYDMDKLDSYYVPGNTKVVFTAKEACSVYIGAAICEGYGKSFFRKFDLSIPLGEIHQIHGGGSGSREVFFTLNPEMPASRLLCGVTWSNDGAWTSWPPHQHEKDLEEVYCYFDTKLGAQLPYLYSGDFENMELNVVKDGHMVMASSGYHPTVSTPGSKNMYFWVLTAFSHESRRYDLAVNDPAVD